MLIELNRLRSVCLVLNPYFIDVMWMTVFAVNSEDHAYLFLNYLIYKHHNIHFNIEGEVNGSPLFLWMFISTFCRFISTSIYKKTSSTLLGTRFFSFSSYCYKLSAITSQEHISYKTCSDWNSFDTGIIFQEVFCTFNLYPSSIQDKAVNHFLLNPLTFASHGLKNEIIL